MDYKKFSKIKIKTSCNERFLIYWRLTDHYENGNRLRKQVLQYTTGLRILPLTFDIIIEFIQIEKGKRLQLLVEERWPLSVEKVLFKSEGKIRTIEYEK